MTLPPYIQTALDLLNARGFFLSTVPALTNAFLMIFLIKHCIFIWTKYYITPT